MKQLISMVRCKVPFMRCVMAFMLSLTLMPLAMACVVAKDCPPCSSAVDTYGNFFSSLSACQAFKPVAGTYGFKYDRHSSCIQKTRVCAKGNWRSHSTAGCACVAPWES